MDAKSDVARPLTTQGLVDVARAGKWISQFGSLPQKILCSPALRTQQTLEQLHQYLSHVSAQFDEGIYLALNGGDLVSVIRRHVLSDIDELLIVGHNPSISDFVSHLAEDHFSFTPGSCVILRCESESWDEALSSYGLWNVKDKFTP